MDPMVELVETCKQIGVAFEDFKKKHDGDVEKMRVELKALSDHREALERKVNLARVRGTGTGAAANEKPEAWIDAKSRRPVPVLTHKMRLADLEEPKTDTPQISIGRMLRGMVLGNRADDRKELAEEFKALGIVPDTSGGYTVPSALSSQWIDLLRAQMVLSQAGVAMVPMPGKTLTIARVTGDPVVSWHGENAALTGSDPTFGAVELSAKTVVCLVRFSLEVSQDSANIESVLQSTLTSATAQAIDSAGLIGIAVDAGAAPAGIMNSPNRNKVTSIGAPTSWDWVVDGMYELALDNVPMSEIGALIAHPAVWKKMRKLKTGLSGDNTPLVAPEEVQALPKLWTTAAPLVGGTTANGIIGRWPDLLFGVRQNLNVRLLDQAFMGSNLQLAMLVYARCDFVPARETSFCTLEGVTV